MRFSFHALLVISTALVLGQTSSVSLISGYRVQPDITYMTEGSWEGKVDVYRRTDSATHPTLVYFHGGNSVGGSKESVVLNLLPYLEWGWNVVNVEHHFDSATIAPAAMANALCSVRWVVQNASAYGFDVNRIVVSGVSSGGWFALTTAMIPMPDGLAPSCSGKEPVKIAAIVNWYGVADLTDVLQGANSKDYAPGWVRNLPNPVEVSKSVSAVNFVRPGLPPVITIHGDADPTVPYSQSVRLHQALKKVNVPEQLITVAGGKHGQFSLPENQRAFAAIRTFLANQGIIDGK